MHYSLIETCDVHVISVASIVCVKIVSYLSSNALKLYVLPYILKVLRVLATCVSCINIAIKFYGMNALLEYFTILYMDFQISVY